MGAIINPEELTESGERACLRLGEIYESRLPPAQLITSVGTVVERHVAAVLGRLIYMSDVQLSPIGSALVDKLSDSMNASWFNRKEWLSKGFDINYSGAEEAKRFQTLVELRNAVVHGDGALSDMQEKRSVGNLIQLRADFREHLSTRVLGRAEFGADASERAMSIAREFILHFDKIVIEKHPEVRRF